MDDSLQTFLRELTEAKATDPHARDAWRQRAATIKILSDEAAESIGDAYRQMGSDSRLRGVLLTMLAESRSPQATDAYLDLFVTDPLCDSQDAALAVAPFLATDRDSTVLFPRLLEGIEHLSTASVILDLANHVAREGKVDVHPAAGRVQHLATLLGGVVGQLQRIEEQSADDASLAQRSAQVSESIALVVALCDALALIGDPSLTGKLYQAMQLRHRRLRAEAAAALARLGDEKGIESLVELAAEPVVRSRALSYLDELGSPEAAAAEHRSAAAKAEGDLAVWLADPLQFASPPGQIELIDSHAHHWPGYEEAVDCYLFRYVYATEDGLYSGTAIVGPVVFTLRADLDNLPTEDLYAIFAGWQARHESIREVDAADANEQEAAVIGHAETVLRGRGYDAVQVVRVGYFFEEVVIIATAMREGGPGTVIVADDRDEWFPQGSPSRPITPDEAYWIHKGRKILKTFNS